MTASELAARLDAKPNGTGWSARCPAHDDTHPSLSIAEGDSGGVVLYCHAQNCRPEAIVTALGLTMRDIAGNATKTRTAKPTIKATYDYENEHDELLYQVVRFDPKDFRQRRPTGKDKWTWKLGDVRRVIYALPDVRLRLNDPGAQQHRQEHGLPDDVFTTEGEKDTDHLLRRGLIATCNAGGAGKWKDDYAQQLVAAGATRVTILPDNDEPGRRHAIDVARSCHAAGLVVKVVALPDLPEKGDVSDWLTLNRHDLQSLLAIVAAAPVWTPEKVDDLAAVIGRVEKFIRTYVVLTPDQAVAVALWVLHTHTIDAADTTPYLRVTSAIKQSGKTRKLEVLETLVAAPWFTGRVSAAALVRKVDGDKPTLLLDESDAAFKGEPEYTEALRGLLNTGYKRNGRSTLCVGKGADIRVKDFSTFCPKAIAGIGQLPDTIADRSIPIVLQRRLASEPIERWRDRDGRAAADPIRQQVEIWSATATATLRAARPSLPTALSDRAQDVWEPLLAIADLAGGEWPGRARRAAVALVGTSEDTDPTTELLTDIGDLLKTTTTDVIATKVILDYLGALDHRPWPTWRRGEKPITARGLARLLGPLGVHPDQRRINGEVLRSYRHDALLAAVARYLPPQVNMCDSPNEYGPEPRHRSDLAAPSKNSNCDGVSPMNPAAVTHTHIDRRVGSNQEGNTTNGYGDI